MKQIRKYFPELSDKQIQQLDLLKDIYVDWNSKINVISRKDMDNFYEHHVLHSLGIAKIISFKPNTSILDVGTGGGFPGIPLAILFPKCEFLLVDSIGKKIKVVNSVVESIGLKNVKAMHIRADEVDGDFDFVVSRAVTRLPDFVKWVKGKIKERNKNAIPNGILYLKGGDVQEELMQSGLKGKVFPLKDYFAEPFFETKNLISLYRKG